MPVVKALLATETVPVGTADGGILFIGIVLEANQSLIFMCAHIHGVHSELTTFPGLNVPFGY